MDTSASDGGDDVPCPICHLATETRLLEQHVNVEHLDYFPFSCGHCGIQLPTEQMARFHGERKGHLPLRIRENVDMDKDAQLQGLLRSALAQSATPSLPLFDADRRVSEPDADPRASEGDDDGRASSSGPQPTLPVADKQPEPVHDEVKVEPADFPAPAKRARGRPRKRPKPDSATPPEPEVAVTLTSFDVKDTYNVSESSESTEEKPIKRLTRLARKSSPTRNVLLDKSDLISRRRRRHRQSSATSTTSSEIKSAKEEVPSPRQLRSSVQSPPTPPPQATSESPPCASPLKLDEAAAKSAAAVVTFVQVTAKDVPTAVPAEINAANPAEIVSSIPADVQTNDPKKTIDAVDVKVSARFMTKPNTAARLRSKISHEEKRKIATERTRLWRIAKKRKLAARHKKSATKEGLSASPPADSGTTAAEDPRSHMLIPPEPLHLLPPTPKVEPPDELPEQIPVPPQVPVDQPVVSEMDKLAGAIDSSPPSETKGETESAEPKKETTPTGDASEQSSDDHEHQRRKSQRVTKPVHRIVMEMTSVTSPLVSESDEPQSPAFVVPPLSASVKAILDAVVDEGSCRLCSARVRADSAAQHVAKHEAEEPRAACLICGQRSHSAQSIRSHISWKHPGQDVREAVRHLDASRHSFDDFVNLCFNPAAPASADKPQLLAKNLNVARPFAQRAAKSLGSSRTPLQSPAAVPLQYPAPEAKPAIAECARRSSSDADEEESPIPLPVELATPRSERPHRPPPGPPDTVHALLAASSFLADGVSTAVTRVSTNESSGRSYRYLKCLQCGAEILDACIGQHIFTAHIDKKDLVQCGYCDFSLPYAINDIRRLLKTPNGPRQSLKSGILRHQTANHPSLPENIVDQRKQDDIRQMYKEWRWVCFPEIKGNSSGCKAASGTLRTPESQDGSCNRCAVAVKPAFEARHIWEHLHEAAQPRLTCLLGTCDFGTHSGKLMEAHGEAAHGRTGLGACGLVRDRTAALEPDFSRMWRLCFPSKAPLVPTAAAGLDPDTSILHRLLNEAPKLLRPLSPDAAGPSNAQASRAASFSPELLGERAMAVFRLDAPFTHCILCNFNIPAEKVDVHVYDVHLRRIRPFRCAHCRVEFMDRDGAYAHAAEVHCGHVESPIVNQVIGVLGQFRRMQLKCFPHNFF